MLILNATIQGILEVSHNKLGCPNKLLFLVIKLSLYILISNMYKNIVIKKALFHLMKEKY